MKRSGDDTAYPRQATELVQFLVQRLRDIHDGSSNIPKLTSFGAGTVTKKTHEAAWFSLGFPSAFLVITGSSAEPKWAKTRKTRGFLGY
jgi:hypothetical protein